MMRTQHARIRTGCLASVVVLALSGCNAQQLRFTTMRLSETIPDLQERQVIENLARIAANPGALPYYSVISNGTANINDNASGGLFSLFLQHRVYPSATLDATASRSVTGNWTLNPMTNPDRLRAMRAAYQLALGAAILDPVDEKKLEAIQKDQKDIQIPAGWVCVGRKRDVPRDACIVSHCGKTYVWVVPGHSKDFADFALFMLNIATWIPPTAKAPSPIAPREALPRRETEEAESPGIQMRLYEDSTGINRGLFFVPR
jgi:hypothetical protein